MNRTKLVDDAGRTIASHGTPEEAVEHAFDLAIVGEAVTIHLPSGRIWAMVQRPSGVWGIEDRP
jgi:hypothetical protein